MTRTNNLTALLALLLGAAGAHRASSEPRRLAVGSIATMDSRSPATWGMSGMTMVTVLKGRGEVTPIMRTALWDARTTEILSRIHTRQLVARDVRPVRLRSTYGVAVGPYLLMEVTAADAAAERISRRDLAARWASRVARVLPAVAPLRPGAQRVASADAYRRYAHR